MVTNCRVPNSNDQKILISLNKTVDDLFREATFKLNRDFHLQFNLWFYEDEFGWQNYEGKMKEGNDNYIQVWIKPKMSLNHAFCHDTVVSNLA